MADRAHAFLTFRDRSLTRSSPTVPVRREDDALLHHLTGLDPVSGFPNLRTYLSDPSSTPNQPEGTVEVRAGAN